MKCDYTFTSVLRIWEYLLYDKNKQHELFRLLEAYPNAYDDVIVFTQNNHSVRTLETHRKTAACMEPILRKIETYGIRSGIDVLCTVGFFKDNPSPEMDGKYPPYITMSGEKACGRICAEVPESRAYIAEQYQIYARLQPGMIYIDDDISAMSCFCPACVKRFAKEYGFMPKEAATREKLVSLLESDDLTLRKQVRDAWIDFNAVRIAELFALIEKSVHEVNPGIPLGFMSHVAGTDGLENEIWARALRGGTANTLSWRPGGGVYTEFTPNEVLDKANRISAQIRYLPDYVTRVESEIENFPYHSLRKSPGFTAFESLVYLAAGCTGTAFNVCSTESFQPEEYGRFFQMAQDVRPASKTIVDFMKRAPAKGIAFPWGKRTAANPLQHPWALYSNSNMPLTNELAQIGLPTASNWENTCVFLLDASIAVQLTDQELLHILTAGVLMSTEALNICNQRGFGDYTGFITKEGFPEATHGRDTSHPFNMPGCHIRDVRQAFGYCGTIYTIEKTAEAAQYLTEAIDFAHQVRGMSSGIYENPYGGRIAVDGIQPFSWAYTLPRSIQIKNICRWLSRDTLGAYIASYHRLALWQRGDGIFLANFAMERAEKAAFALHEGPENLEAFIFEAGKLIEKQVLHPQKQDGVYRIYQLPTIPITGEVLVHAANEQEGTQKEEYRA